MSVFVEIILVYLLYRFIAGFLIPLFRTTYNMRQQFRDMNSRPPSGGQTSQPRNSSAGSDNHQSRNSSAGSDARSNTPKSTAPKTGEYIDFEEIN